MKTLSKRADSKKPNAAAPRKKKSDEGVKSLRQDLKRFTRERLVQAAMDCFTQEGYRATTVERIVELAGTTTPTFYRHFSSKSDLLKPLRQHLTIEVRKSLEPLNKISLDLASVRDWLDIYMEMWQRMHRLCTAYWEACEIDDEFAADTIPSALVSVNNLTELLDRFDPSVRESVSLRLALLVPVLDRVMKTVSALEDSGLRERLLDEFAVLFLSSITYESLMPKK